MDTQQSPEGTVMDPVGTQQVSQGQPGQSQSGRERHTIWQGVLEWIEKTKNPNGTQILTCHVPCQISAKSKDGEPELKADSWPQKLIVHSIPVLLMKNVGGDYLKNSKSVLFHPSPCKALERLTEDMSKGFAGYVHFTSMSSPSACDIKILALLYSAVEKAYLGFIPNDQAEFVDILHNAIEHQKSICALLNQGGRERLMIWIGDLGWLEKTNTHVLTHYIHCQVSANSKEGEPELRAKSWPQELIMHFKPKLFIRNIISDYLKNSKCVHFYLSPCKALERLTKVMSNGIAGYVHFTSMSSPSACDIEILVIVYSTKRRAYLGFIPNDQAEFVDKLYNAIEHRRSIQALLKQGQAVAPGQQGVQGAGSMGALTSPQGGPLCTQQGGGGPMAGQLNAQASQIGGLINSQLQENPLCVQQAGPLDKLSE